MFREMRRKNQDFPREECIKILENTTHGVLSLLGDDGYPYGVPLNHVLLEDTLYFHCAMEGHKADAIRSCDRASFCAIDVNEVDGKNLTTRFRSVMAFGRVRMVEDKETKRKALMAIGKKFASEYMEKAEAEIKSSLEHTGIIEMCIEHISGKESRALARERCEKGHKA